jgi:hypothetical protein
LAESEPIGCEVVSKQSKVSRETAGMWGCAGTKILEGVESRRRSSSPAPEVTEVRKGGAQAKAHF